MKKILVANRGEIALRVMRSAKEMGIKTVAVYSEADRTALHTRYADEAIFIGEAAAKESYLVADKIIAACKATGADGIHPGYGFLSENADFAQQVKDAGITFIGPSPDSIKVMGSKLAAKEAAGKYNVPMVPGTDKAITDIKAAKDLAENIGFPILIKASAGGGGKGMRVVNNREEFEEQMARAQSEAQSAFGDSAVFIEKYVGAPRHIEIQILGDQHGNIVYLFERECTIQRRHQKVVEEAPSSVVSPEMRKKMGESAVMIGKACGYYGAGTVEFLVDEQLNYYFLEMNTRLQVEHPVTEMITGIDLVKEQIKIARGEKLSFTQEDLEIKGHAMELRVYAEDPANNFLPDIGRLNIYVRPQGAGVRVDDGYEAGMEIPIFYDPMIAKLITYGKDRKEAIDRMVRAIEEYKISGVENTLAFGKWVMQHDLFIKGDMDTNFIAKHFKPEYLNQQDNAEMEIAALLATHFLAGNTGAAKNTGTAAAPVKKSNWKRNRV